MGRLNLTINASSEQDVLLSFDRIANDLFNKFILNINGFKYFFTEIEFYYNSSKHPDDTTHQHNVPEGFWRAHNSGIDIALNDNNGSYGGILVRGIRTFEGSPPEYINGPRKVVCHLFKHFNDIYSQSSLILEPNPNPDQSRGRIFNIPRQGLSDKKKYYKNPYRFVVELKNCVDIPEREISISGYLLSNNLCSEDEIKDIFNRKTISEWMRVSKF